MRLQGAVVCESHLADMEVPTVNLKNRAEQAKQFRALHARGNPIVLFNIWDAGSAKAVAEAGAKAIATGSWSVAAAHGFPDGESIPWALALANLERIARSTDLPVTADIETGYDDVATTVRQTIAAGAIGCNFEDGIIGAEGLRSIEDQSARLRASRAAADESLPGVFINARTDVFLRADPSTHSDQMVDEVIARAAAYARAGADGLFVPGLLDAKRIERICAQSSLPVNVMLRPGDAVKAFAKLGVARVSYGPNPFRLAMAALRQAASEAMA
jgi:2-methylisocitrate lyase-like PEP mutase family enzyme